MWSGKWRTQRPVWDRLTPSYFGSLSTNRLAECFSLIPTISPSCRRFRQAAAISSELESIEASFLSSRSNRTDQTANLSLYRSLSARTSTNRLCPKGLATGQRSVSTVTIHRFRTWTEHISSSMDRLACVAAMPATDWESTRADARVAVDGSRQRGSPSGGNTPPVPGDRAVFAYGPA